MLNTAAEKKHLGKILTGYNPFSEKEKTD